MKPFLASSRVDSDKRRLLQWLLAPIAILTLVVGWKFVWLGFTVPVVMAIGVIGGLLRGRYVCGNFCPRGSFFDRILAKMTSNRKIPSALRSMGLRAGIFSVLMGFLLWRLAADPSNADHWGFVFWSMCAITTSVGIVLALLYHPRAWCAVCPVGSLANVIGGDKYQLNIAVDCRECGKCEQSCTFDLPIVKHKDLGVVQERDCLKCSLCLVNCPTGALQWPGAV